MMTTDERRARAIAQWRRERPRHGILISDMDLARAIRVSDEAAGMVLVPREKIDKVKEIRADLEEFDGDRRGHWYALQEAEEQLVLAMIAAATEADHG